VNPREEQADSAGTGAVHELTHEIEEHLRVEVLLARDGVPTVCLLEEASKQGADELLRDGETPTDG
jgi:hypothetical protein